MCGIVAVVAKNGAITKDQLDIFEELLYADALRGMDSTGVFAVDRKNRVDTIKQAVGPEFFLKGDSWKKLRNHHQGDGLAVVGHNRKATVGNIITKNAHPFVDKNIVLVHNGYIANHEQLDKSKEVDSETIITALTSEENYLKGLEKLFGAFAIVWYDHSKKKLFMTRNSERPLFYCHTSQSFFVSSEADMLRWILNRNNVSYETPVQIPAGRVLEIRLKPFQIEGAEIPKTTYVKPTPNHDVWNDVDGNQTIDPWEGMVRPTNDGQRRGPAEEELEIPTLGKPNVGDNAEQVVKMLMKTYHQGKRVYFEPTGFVNVDKRVEVTGWVWFPGEHAAKGVWCYQKKDDNRELEHHDVSKRGPLLATCLAVSRRNTDVNVMLTRVDPASDFEKDWNGQVTGAQEWTDIRNNEVCTDCGSTTFKAAELEHTILNRHKGCYSVVCARCVASMYSGTKDKHEEPSLTELARARMVGNQIAAETGLDKKVKEGETGGAQGG
jgi:hypothetical protein